MESAQAPQFPSAQAPKPKLLGILAILLAVVVVAVAAWLIWAAWSDRNEEDTPSAIVNITADGFVPSTIIIKKRSDLTWRNKDDVPHDLKSDNEDLGLKTTASLSQGTSFTFVFDESGTYTYHDPLNPALKGTVVVE